jgi:pimeloyl-ACP methyl ester carboxylesterase
MWGDRDAYALRASQERLLAVIPGSRLIVYQGAGHAFHWEDSVQFPKDLVRLVASGFVLPPQVHEPPLTANRRPVWE